MAKIIKNIDTVEHTWVGQTIPSGSSYQIQTSQDNAWANDSLLMAAIGSGIAVVNNGSTDITDVNMAINWMKNIIPRQVDSDNAILSRIKAAPTGWTFILKGFEFKTSSFGSVVNVDYLGNDMADISMSFYDAANVLITDPSLISTNTVKTVIDYEPRFDYYLIGGISKILATPSTDVRLHIVMAPDIPASYGGSKPLVCNVNFKFIQPGDKVEADGRAAKQLTYNPIYHSNKMRFILKHGAGAIHEIAVLLEFYRQ